MIIKAKALEIDKFHLNAFEHLFFKCEVLAWKGL
jgi:hypothetical protein